MEWAVEQARVRDRYWESLERLLRGLEPRVAEPFRLLEFELALHYSPTGRLRDVFTGVERPPLPSIGPWLLTDLGSPPSPRRDALASQLFCAGVLLGAREHLLLRLADSESFAAAPQLTLALDLSDRAAALKCFEAVFRVCISESVISIAPRTAVWNGSRVGAETLRARSVRSTCAATSRV